MDKDTKNLIKIYSILFLFLATWDIISLITSYVNGQMQVDALVEQGTVSESLANGVLIAIIAITAVFALIKLLIGLKGLKLIKDDGGTVSGLMPMLKFLLVFEIIALIATVSSMFSADGSWSQLGSSAASVIILFDYLRRVKTAASEG